MLKRIIKSIFQRFGYDIVKCGYPADFEKRDIEIIQRATPYTITGDFRLHALVSAVRYVVRARVEGSFVECGVYKGGSMMAVALTLMQEGVTDRDLYLFDTFEGMPVPGKRDVDLWGKPAMDEFSEHKLSDTSSTWVNAPLEAVKAAMASTGYPAERVHCVKGLVENTIPANVPRSIALLRLDTDWYESTRHELVHLYPLISPRGLMIVDDYGHYKGAREAVDGYFAERGATPYLHRIDYTGRLILKGV